MPEENITEPFYWKDLTIDEFKEAKRLFITIKDELGITLLSDEMLLSQAIDCYVHAVRPANETERSALATRSNSLSLCQPSTS